ncbi:MAG: TIGR02710 family CRISPR-associated protein [Chloroflexi bacterium]|nr:TIGR02710 family CRISPR-associated protein [Chloroflexota bacterium]
MKSALIVTVGTADPTQPDRVTSLVDSIKSAIQKARSERVVLLASDGSMALAERVRAELDRGEQVQISRVSDSDHYERVFQDALVVFRTLRETCEPAEIELDFTSGTKAMSVGAALAAAVVGSGEWRYTAGDRPTGTVAAGTEEILSRSPMRVRAHFDLQAAVRLFEALQFAAARTLLSEINPGLLDDHGRRLHASLMVLVDAYDAWDKFDHAGFKDRYRKPDADLHDLGAFAVADKVRGSIGQMASANSRPPSGGRKTTTTADHLADLWNNAQRRLAEGKLDDAVARLYRLTEMIAQYVLDSTYGIETSNVELSALPAELTDNARTWLEAIAVVVDAQGNESRQPVKLGLRDDFRLLAGLGHAIGPLVSPFGAKPTRLNHFLDTRNASILAHGTTPISADDAHALAEEVRELAVLAVPDFEARAARLQFPWLATKE